MLQTGDIQSIRKEFRAPNSAFANYNAALSVYNSSLSTAPNATGDQELITNYAKMLDPGSVVREGEFATTANTQAYVDKIKAELGRQTGMWEGGMLTQAGRNAIRTGMRNMAENRFRPAYQQDRDYYTSIANSAGYDPNLVVGPDPYSAYQKRIDDYWAKQGVQSPDAGGAAPPPSVAPIEAGRPFQTEADLAAQRQLQDAWNRSLSVDELIQFNQQIGRGAFSPEDIQRMRDARAQNKPEAIRFYARPTGQPTTAQGIIGAALETPVGEAVGGYGVGAANALTAGTLDELAPILGLDPARVQAAKDYLRERAPVSSLAGEVTGGIIGSIPVIRGAGAALAGTRLAGASPLIGETLYGAGYGAGEAPEGQRALGALIGGGAAGVGGALANRFLPGGPGTFTGMVPEVPAGAVVPEVPPVAAAVLFSGCACSRCNCPYA